MQQNHHWLVLNKPPGMPVQPDRTGDANLLTAAQAYCKRSLHVHNRLDRPASGLVLMSKTTQAHQHFHRLQTSGDLTRKYWAITANAPREIEGEAHGSIRKLAKSNRSVWQPEADGPQTKEASLRYKVLDSSDRYYLWEVELMTGRHHQIRAFLQYLECPIRGDVKYGYRRSNPQHHIQLHAREMQFVDMDQQTVQQFVAPLPEERIWHIFTLTQKHE